VIADERKEGSSCKSPKECTRPTTGGRGSFLFKDSTMKKTRLNVFYHLGEALEDLHKLRIGMEFSEAMVEMIRPQQWLAQFDWESLDVPLDETRAAAKAMLNFVNNWLVSGPAFIAKQPFSQQNMNTMQRLREKFLEEFEREYSNLGVLIFTPKRLLDTKLLVNKPEMAFEEKVRKHLPAQTLHDFTQAARCLAFEIPTACAFHVCRGTEALILHYYEKLAGQPWPYPKTKDWYNYIDHLKKHQAPDKITMRLDEIRKFDRNAYIHPDINVSLEEAPVLFNLCDGVILYMVQEVERLTP
jgi:hypothetical protein